MLSKMLQEKINKWSTELDEIKEKINDLNSQKIEAAAAIQVALKAKNPDEIISAQQTETKLAQEIQALKLIEAEVAKTYPVTVDEFNGEYAAFFKNQKEILDKDYDGIINRLMDLKDAYYDYEQAYNAYIANLRVWQNLAEKAGLNKPLEIKDATQVYGKFKNEISRTIGCMTGGRL